MERATCWSITINNPTESEYTQQLPAKWTLKGQIEQGKEGTVHYQGMLTTPQVRFSAVKKVFNRAHIEVARNRSALASYVNKEETRLQAVPDNVSTIPTLFDYQHIIARRWNDDEFDELLQKWKRLDDAKKCIGDIALDYVDTLVAEDIEAGLCGVEYIAINPMWRSAWKKFYKSMVAREKLRGYENNSNTIIYPECPTPADTNATTRNEDNSADAE